MQQETWNPGFPVHIYQDGMTLPKTGTYFVVAGNGLWLHKDTGICQCFVPVKNISCLDDLVAETEVQVKLPKVPANLICQIKEFFRQVVEKYNSEAEITLYFNRENGQYKVYVPTQKVSHGSVHYKRVGTTHISGLENYLPVGTIHSHCDFGAFHSGTDVGDEEHFDGLHITFGHNDREVFTISASLVVNGHRTVVDPLVVCEGVECSRPEHNVFGSGYVSEAYYRLNTQCSPEELKEIEEWMTRVSPLRTFAVFNNFNFFTEKFAVGSQIVWADDMKSDTLRRTCGEGPFEVLMHEGNKVCIKTSTGRVKLSEKLFKKHEG